MRTALVLLLALASASIFGSLFPQQNISPQRVQEYAADHPALASLLDRLGMFDVFGAPWFMAIYLALLTALVACLVPRITAYLRLLRARPHPPPAAARPLPQLRQLPHGRLPGAGRRADQPDAQAPSLPAGHPRPRRALRREGLSARGGQPAVPRLLPGPARRARRRQGLRLPRPDHHRRGRDLGRRPHQLRRLQSRALLQRR